MADRLDLSHARSWRPPAPSRQCPTSPDVPTTVASPSAKPPGVDSPSGEGAPSLSSRLPAQARAPRREQLGMASGVRRATSAPALLFSPSIPSARALSTATGPAVNSDVGPARELFKLPPLAGLSPGSAVAIPRLAANVTHPFKRVPGSAGAAYRVYNHDTAQAVFDRLLFAGCRCVRGRVGRMAS